MHRSAVLLPLAVLAACGELPPPGAAASQSLQARARACEDIGAALTRASDGLLYLSESDRPFTFVAFPFQTLPTPEELALAVGLPPDAAEVQVQDFGAFFQRLTRFPERGVGDPAVEAQARETARRYRQLRQTFRQTYRELRVYRVRDRISAPAVWRVFILGVHRCGVSGLETVAIET